MSEQPPHSSPDSLESDKRLLPYLPFLLQDLWGLGGSIDQIIEVIGTLNLPSQKTKILDLGCGKGAVSIQAASRFGFKAVGVDMTVAFLKEASLKAREFDVSHLCLFINQDIREYVSTQHDYDLVILASLGGIFGSLKNTIRILRNQVRPGGFMLLDDGFLRKGNFMKRNGYGHYRSHRATIGALTSFGDSLLTEVCTTASKVKANEEYLSLIETRGKELVGKQPEQADQINEYLVLQAEQCEVIKNNIEGILWLLQRRD